MNNQANFFLHLIKGCLADLRFFKRVCEFILYQVKKMLEDRFKKNPVYVSHKKNNFAMFTITVKVIKLSIIKDTYYSWTIKFGNP